MARDMTLFVDDDGKAYQFYSSEDNATMHVSELTSDYLKPAGRYTRILVGRSMEAPAVFKRGGKYYIIASGCTGWEPNTARSAVADSIWGPWIELGNPCPWRRRPTRSTAKARMFCRCKANGALSSSWPTAGSNGTCRIRLWLPLVFDAEGKPVVNWRPSWSLKDLAKAGDPTVK